MRFSNPTTVTLVSILMQNLLLWTAVFLTGGLHAVLMAGILLFVVVGIFQLGGPPVCAHWRRKDRRFTQQRAPGGEPVDQRDDRNHDPREQTSRLIVLGTFLIVGGIVLVAWKPDEQISRLIGGFISEPSNRGRGLTPRRTLTYTRDD